MELFRLAERPTAIVVCNNLMTLGLLKAIRDASLLCPQEVSIVGFDDFEWCPHVFPPLSMVRVPAAELGSVAANVLMKQIQGSDGCHSERVLLPTELVVRESTCSVRTR
jgi:LacI family transcriptional regulator